MQILSMFTKILICNLILSRRLLVPPVIPHRDKHNLVLYQQSRHKYLSYFALRVSTLNQFNMNYIVHSMPALPTSLLTGV